MARRRLPQFTDNQDRWVVSYADFITLLFAFFVAMYSTAYVSEGEMAARLTSTGSLVQLISSARSDDNTSGVEAANAWEALFVAEAPDAPLRDATKDPVLREIGVLPSAQLQGVEVALNASLGDRVAEDGVMMTSDGNWLEIRIPAHLLFPSGSRAILAEAEPMLAALALRLAAIPNDVVVEGHTDNQPIRNGLFPSNWELSVARAAAVVRILEREGVASDRLRAVGYAATRPVVDNATEDGRNVNRRVVLLVRALAEEGRGDTSGRELG